MTIDELKRMHADYEASKALLANDKGYPSPNLHSPAKLELDEKTRIVESLLQQGLISQKDMNVILGTPNMCDSFKQSFPMPSEIDTWLLKNGYYYSLAQDQYIKLAPVGKVHPGHCVTIEHIQKDPYRVINAVTSWHKQYTLFYHPWDWHDEETRKIDLEALYKDKKADTTWCNHEWVEYVGLNEKFRYCKHCDKKWEDR